MLLLVAGVALLAGCTPEPLPKEPKGPIRRTVSARSAFMAWQEPGPDGRVRPVLELEAVTGQLQQDRQSGTFEDAEARVYTEGKLAARVTAPHVRAQAERKYLVAWGGVTVLGERPEGLRIQARRVEWYLDRNLVVARGEVRFVHRDPQTGRLVAEGGVFEQVRIDTVRHRLTIP